MEVKNNVPPEEETQMAEPVADGTPTENTETKEIKLTKEEFDQVKKHIDQLKSDNESLVYLAQRVQADFDNFRRRNAAVHAESIEEGERNVIAGLLPAVDNLERAVDACEGADKALTDGIKMVQKQLLDALKKFGLDEVEATGKFDPNMHEAVMHEEIEGVESGNIAEVFQKGYKVKNRIIRHSMVKVAK